MRAVRCCGGECARTSLSDDHSAPPLASLNARFSFANFEQIAHHTRPVATMEESDNPFAATQAVVELPTAKDQDDKD